MIIKKFPEDFYVKEVISFPKEGEDYAYFLMWKRNISTIRAIKIVKRKFGISKYRISFAGEKDKKAVTEQFISIANFRPDKEYYDFGNVKLKFVGYFSEPISIKHLVGNEFKIVIRDVSEKEREEFYKIYPILLKNGFPNYFDEQRFGDIRCINHLIGIELLKRNYEKACRILLTYFSEKEKSAAQKARRFLNENWGEFSEALKLFPKYLDIETPVLNYLVKKPNDFKGALKQIHKKLLRLFVHAVQSYIFNLTLNKLIRSNCSYKELKFSFGNLSFPYNCSKDLKYLYIPLVGYDTNLEDYPEEIKTSIEEILSKLEISLDMFKFEDFKILQSGGSKRKAFEFVSNFEFEDLGDKFVLKFFLPKGSYATIVIKYLFLT